MLSVRCASRFVENADRALAYVRKVEKGIQGKEIWNMKKEVTIAITAASYSGNKGAAAMLQSSICQLKERYGSRLHIYLMSVYPAQDRLQCPHKFVTVVPAQPQRLLFLAFPCAVLYRSFGWCPPLRALLLKNNILHAYLHTDLVIDEAGIAFSDSRGWILNTYAFVCAAVPMLMGIGVVKYSQALGPFHHAYNRMLAKWILPEMKLIAARGRFTYGHLRAIGIRRQVRLYADGAFTMPADRNKGACEKLLRCKEASGVPVRLAALAVSSVVERRCNRAGIDYCKIMAGFIAYLTGQGYQVFLFANAARMHSRRPRNNDLMTGDKVAWMYQQMKAGPIRIPQSEKKRGGSLQASDTNGLIWEHREMDAEEIRASIGQCDFLITSRFHAMVFALSEQVPVMLVGWSHKYQEVMEQFGLAEYAEDYSSLSLDGLIRRFEIFLEHQEEIKYKIRKHLPVVQKSSSKNIRHIAAILDKILMEQETERKKTGCACCMNHVIDLKHPQRYTGGHLRCLMGYASDAGIRAKAASGGMVTALLCSLLKNGEIDGAWVVRTAFTKEGQLTYKTGIATSAREIRAASSSVYMDIPMLAHLAQLRAFDGRLAVVLTPCMMRAFCRVLETDDALREKIVLKIGLFCSGAHDKRATEYALDKCGIERKGAKRLYYRTGHWRGRSSVEYADGSRKTFSYTKSICAYKNAYFFIRQSCLHCRDQFAECADISFGDVWLSQMKKEKKKYTGCVIRSEKALQMVKRAVKQKDLCVAAMTEEQLLRSQKRALTFKYRDSRWNHRLAGYLAGKNREFSMQHPELLKKVPMQAVYFYMCAIRLLLSW